MCPPTEAPPRRSAAGEAWWLMQRLFVSQRARLLAIAAEFELTRGQLMALRSLDPAEPVPMRELAEKLCCDNSNVTGIIDRLEARDLVQRCPAPADRRVKMLVVTPEGADVRRRLRERMAQPPEALERLSDDEQRTLLELMRKALGDEA